MPSLSASKQENHAGVAGRPASAREYATILLALAIIPPCALLHCEGAWAQAGAQGVPGSAGMDDSEGHYLAAVKQAGIRGKTSREYIESLIGLGMHYNRQEDFGKAARTLRQALAIIDAGALKPTPAQARKPERIVEKRHDGGVVSAEVVRSPMPYEETLEELLPQLLTAESGENNLAQASAHMKRLIALPGTNPVAKKASLMSAYMQYAELLRKRGLTKEAESYERKADEINRSFKPL